MVLGFRGTGSNLGFRKLQEVTLYCCGTSWLAVLNSAWLVASSFCKSHLCLHLLWVKHYLSIKSERWGKMGQFSTLSRNCIEGELQLRRICFFALHEEVVKGR